MQDFAAIANSLIIHISFVVNVDAVAAAGTKKRVNQEIDLLTKLIIL